MNSVTQLLEAANRGDGKAAAELLPLVYDELRQLAAAKMAQEKPGLREALYSRLGEFGIRRANWEFELAWRVRQGSRNSEAEIVVAIAPSDVLSIVCGSDERRRVVE